VRSTAAVLDRAAAAGVEMPIAEQVQAVLDGARTPAAAVASLMMREAKSELDGIRLLG
jgi:glycerol-3-phosphate dehydrogenase